MHMRSPRGGISLMSMLAQDDHNTSEGNRVRVVFVESKTDCFLDIPRERWYSITVSEFSTLVDQHAPKNPPPSSLFLSFRGKEELLTENSLLTSYDITNKESMLLYKAKPKLISVYFHKHFYVDADVSVSDALPLIHYALSRNDWISDDEAIYKADSSTKNLPLADNITDSYDTSVLSSNGFSKVKEKHQLILDNENEAKYFMYSDSKPLVACEPSPILQFSHKKPKQKSRSFTSRNAEFDSKDNVIQDKVQSQSIDSKSTEITSKVKSDSKSKAKSDPKIELKSEKSDAEYSASSPSAVRRVLEEGGVIDEPSEIEDEELKLEPVEEVIFSSKIRSKSKPKGFNFRSDSSFLGRRKSKEELIPMNINIPIHLQSVTANDDDGIRIFSIPIERVMERKNETERAPKVIIQMANYLEKTNALKAEGIFRLCGTQNRILALINEIDGGEELDLSKYDIHEIASVFKLYFQLLPQPLFTFVLYPRFMAASCLEDKELRNNYYNALLATLPKIRRQVSKFLLEFLRKVASEEKTNKMGPKNLGIVFGPMFLQSQKRETDVYKSYLHYSKYIINCTKHMVSSLDNLFTDCQPIELVRTLTSRIAKKPGELDLTENSEICIITREDGECFSESCGRFGTLPTHFLYGSDGKLKCAPTESTIIQTTPSKKIARSKNKKSKRLSIRRMASPLGGEEFETTFGVTKEIFILLPKWKQDEMLRAVGLLDPKKEEEGSIPPLVKSATLNRTTIPVRPRTKSTSSDA